jgi:hypothetical protein
MSFDTDGDVLKEAKKTVREMYPLAYQDYLGHVWTDDLYNCDTHCLAASASPLRPDAAEAWLKAAEIVKLTKKNRQ